jgi:hypothetical protein
MTTHALSTPGTTTGTTTTSTTTTRRLLACGAVAGPLYLVVGLTHAFTRDGFDLKRHPMSMLSLGDLGWIQIANFVVAGLLFVASAVGMKRALRTGPGRTWGPLLIGGFGIGLISGGVFVADPALGFPAGAPPGTPAELSWHGALHGVAAGVGLLSLLAACVVFTRRFAARGERGWAVYSAVTGVAVVASGATFGTEWATVVLYVAAVVGWSWVSAVVARHMVQLDDFSPERPN